MHKLLTRDPMKSLLGFEQLAYEEKFTVLDWFQETIETGELDIASEFMVKLRDKLLTQITRDTLTINYPLSRVICLLLQKGKPNKGWLKDQLLFSGCSHRMRILKWFVVRDLNPSFYMIEDLCDLELLTQQIINLNSAAFYELLDLLLTVAEDLDLYFPQCDYYTPLAESLLSTLASTHRRYYEKLRSIKLLSTLIELINDLESV